MKVAGRKRGRIAEQMKKQSVSQHILKLIPRFDSQLASELSLEIVPVSGAPMTMVRGPIGLCLLRVSSRMLSKAAWALM